MKRRAFLASSGMAAFGILAGGCASRQRPNALAAGRAPVRLPPVRVSWDRIIRTTVGLRPHRDAGFVLRADRLDAKTLIHNYGHGGAGMSLSWGTGALAADLALQHQDRRAAVIGCGAVGLSAARQLQRRGFTVTIYTMAVHPDVTSSMSAASFTPTSGLIETGRRTPEWDALFRRSAEIAYRQLQLLASPTYGISWIDSYGPTNEIRPPQVNDLEEGLPQSGREVLQPGEHPFPTTYATRRTQLRIEPSIYLEALMRDVIAFGGRIEIKKFDTPRDLMSLSEPVIVNCSGLGSLNLFGDNELVPLKGQLHVLMAQSEVNYSTAGGVNIPSGPGLGIHMMPRSDGIVMGGTSQRGVWSMEPDEAERKRIVEGHITLFSGMRTT